VGEANYLFWSLIAVICGIVTIAVGVYLWLAHKQDLYNGEWADELASVRQKEDMKR